MSHTVSLIGRLRIERLVLELDQRLWELPHRRRVGCRREVRQNVLAAAREAGVTEALLGIGSVGELARGYLSAEYGDSRRPHWMAVSVPCILLPWLILFVTSQQNIAGEAAIRAADPHATGTFTVPGIAFLQHATVYTFSNGQASVTGGDLAPLCYVLFVAAVIVSGRLWRVRIRRHPAP